MAKPKNLLQISIEMQSLASGLLEKATLVRQIAEERVSTPSKKPIIDPRVVAARIAKRHRVIDKKTKR